MVNKPIFIIGAPRSGTSILGRILENHSDLVHIKEPRFIWRYGNDGKSDILKVEHATPKVKTYIQKKFGEFLTQPNQRLLEKQPSNSLRVSFVKEIFPDAKFIHIMRNGYDATSSIRRYWNGFTSGLSYNRIGSKETILQHRLKEIHWSQVPFYSGEFINRFLPKTGKGPNVMWGPRLPGMKQILKESGLIEICAMQWRNCVERACHDGRKLGDNSYLEVKLEYLTSSDIQKILDFAELSHDEKVFEYMSEKFIAGSSQKSRENLSEKEFDEITGLIAPTLKWLGY